MAQQHQQHQGQKPPVSAPAPAANTGLTKTDATAENVLALALSGKMETGFEGTDSAIAVVRR